MSCRAWETCAISFSAIFAKIQTIFNFALNTVCSLPLSHIHKSRTINDLGGCLFRSHTLSYTEHICADGKMSYKARITLIIPSNLSVANKILWS